MKREFLDPDVGGVLGVLVGIVVFFILFVLLVSCAPVQWSASAVGGYYTKDRLDGNSGRIEAVEERIRALEGHVDTWSAQRWKEFYAEYDLQARVMK